MDSIFHLHSAPPFGLFPLFQVSSTDPTAFLSCQLSTKLFQMIKHFG